MSVSLLVRAYLLELEKYWESSSVSQKNCTFSTYYLLWRPQWFDHNFAPAQWTVMILTFLEMDFNGTLLSSIWMKSCLLSLKS